MSKTAIAKSIVAKPRKLLPKTHYFHAHETARYDVLDGLPLASFRSRAFAILIDLAIVSLFGLPSLLRHHAAHPGETASWAALFEKLFEEIRNLAESVVYFAVTLKVGKGQTPGKWCMKIRVMSLTHHDLSWWQTIERGLGYGASLLEGGFGFVQYFLHRNRMCVHDRIADTIVVDLRKKRHHGHKVHDEASLAPPPPLVELVGEMTNHEQNTLPQG